MTADPLAESAELAAVRAALRDLRRELRSRRPESRAELGAAEPSWVRTVDDLRRRAGTFGMSERSGDVDDFGVDPVALARARPLLDFLLDRYWRVDVRGLDALPAGEPALLVANRSGLVPYDGIVLAHAIARYRPEDPGPRFLVEDTLIALPFVQAGLARIGGVRACGENAARLLRGGHCVIAFPEGEGGATKVFAERYRLRPFGASDVLRAALEARVPIVPVGVVGAEEVHPLLVAPRVSGGSARAPSVPVTPTFPWLGLFGVLPLPAKWVVRIGRPLAAEELGVDALGANAGEDGATLARLGEVLRSRVGRLVDAGLRERSSPWR